ncbi:MAG: hypothetical protein BWY72_01504 [Bacteroidetes bacterium ADurb.Bin416]|nr:MAG: hypothetical protein BWY72_01504 [Bacteroidetes bacterium ADurb.Bin416]
MKKFGLLAALFVLMLSCTIEDTPDTSWKVINVEIRSSDWVADTDDDGINLYYSCRVNMPELSSFIYQNGMVQAYYKTADYQQQLPYVRHYENLAGDLWTRTIDYDYEVGYMNFYVTNSDFVNERPETMKFRIVLLW